MLCHPSSLPSASPLPSPESECNALPPFHSSAAPWLLSMTAARSSFESRSVANARSKFWVTSPMMSPSVLLPSPSFRFPALQPFLATVASALTATTTRLVPLRMLLEPGSDFWEETICDDHCTVLVVIRFPPRNAFQKERWGIGWKGMGEGCSLFWIRGCSLGCSVGPSWSRCLGCSLFLSWGLLLGLFLGLALWEALALSRGSALRADFALFVGLQFGLVLACALA